MGTQIGCNEPSHNLSETPAFPPKFSQSLYKCHAGLEVFLGFLGRVEKELFSNEINDSTKSNHSREEWRVFRFYLFYLFIYFHFILS